MQLQSEVVEKIREFIKAKQEEKVIVNAVVREDVFAILNQECIVLFYALEDDIDGCHMTKPFNNKMQQFVFINTRKNVQEQTWTAAHELGHVWQVDQYIISLFPEKILDSEEIVSKFAAEFLMPAIFFHEEVDRRLKEYHFGGPRMSGDMMVDLVTYLMNFFGVPYKSVIRRFHEMEYISEVDISLYLDTFEKHHDLFLQKKQENQYTRLDVTNEVYAMENIQRDLIRLEEAGVFSEKKMKQIREVFHISKTADKGENLTFEINNGDGKATRSD